MSRFSIIGLAGGEWGGAWLLWPEWANVRVPAKRKKELRELAQMTPEQYEVWKREQELVEREKKKIWKSRQKGK